MQTGYSGPKGNSPRYVCARAKQLYGTERGCCSIGVGRLERTILAELFTVLERACLEATATALAEAEQHYRQGLAAFELSVERARYEASRASRQYDAVEPENRLVARTLDSRARTLRPLACALLVASGADRTSGCSEVPHRGRCGRMSSRGVWREHCAVLLLRGPRPATGQVLHGLLDPDHVALDVLPARAI